MKGLSKYPAKRTGLTDHPFYLAVLTKEVYDVSPNLTNEQRIWLCFGEMCQVLLRRVIG